MPDQRLIEALEKTRPEVASFKVTVFEFCNADHPPSVAEWSYTEQDPVDRGVYTKLKHNKTTMLTGSFDLLSPVHSTAARKLAEHEGKLPTYHSDDSTAVTRRYECSVKYKEEPLKPEGGEESTRGVKSSKP